MNDKDLCVLLMLACPCGGHALIIVCFIDTNLPLWGHGLTVVYFVDAGMPLWGHGLTVVCLVDAGMQPCWTETDCCVFC